MSEGAKGQGSGATAAFTIDLDRCIGCHTCTVACQMEKGLAPGLALIPVQTVGGARDVPQGVYPALCLDYVPRPCAQCQSPPCVPACPSEALCRRDDGLVTIDTSLCTGCGDCLPACPYGAIVMDGEGIAHKCDLCASRLDQGLEPACVICCPTRALTTAGGPATDRGWAPSPHLGTDPALRYSTRDAERRERVRSYLESLAALPVSPNPPA